MNKEPSGWSAFAQRTPQRVPDKTFQEAVRFLQERDAALDMGAGALIETEYLLSAGFKKVVALDVQPGVVNRAKDLEENERLEVVVARFENYAFPINTFDIVNARYSLPFVSPGSFEEVFLKVKDSLKPGGIFVGQLFGTGDHRNSREDMTFHSCEEVEQLLSTMEILELEEKEYDGPTYTQGVQHWHVFDVLARKK